MLKAVSIDSKTSVVWPGDPAIDKEKSDLTAYQKEALTNPSSWRTHLQFLDGQEPTVFEIGVVPAGDLCILEDQAGIGGPNPKPATLRWACFIRGVRELRNGPRTLIKDENGKRKHGVPTVDRAGVDYVDPAWLAEQFIRGLRECGLWVGGVVYHWNQMTEDDQKN